MIWLWMGFLSCFGCGLYIAGTSCSSAVSTFALGFCAAANLTLIVKAYRVAEENTEEGDDG